MGFGDELVEAAISYNPWNFLEWEDSDFELSGVAWYVEASKYPGSFDKKAYLNYDIENVDGAQCHGSLLRRNLTRHAVISYIMPYEFNYSSIELDYIKYFLSSSPWSKYFGWIDLSSDRVDCTAIILQGIPSDLMLNILTASRSSYEYFHDDTSSAKAWTLCREAGLSGVESDFLSRYALAGYHKLIGADPNPGHCPFDKNSVRALLDLSPNPRRSNMQEPASSSIQGQRINDLWNWGLTDEHRFEITKSTYNHETHEYNHPEWADNIQLFRGYLDQIKAIPNLEA